MGDLSRPSPQPSTWMRGRRLRSRLIYGAFQTASTRPCSSWRRRLSVATSRYSAAAASISSFIQAIATARMKWPCENARTRPLAPAASVMKSHALA
jgi:hypothetical protein